MNELAKIALGRVAAVERVVAVLIAAHPAPEALSEAWRAIAPGMREDLHAEFAKAPEFLRAALAALDRFDRTMQRAHAATAPGGAPTDH